MRLRCARCGGPHVLSDWFHLEERCPTCGWRFEHEESFFLGAYLLNLCLILTVLFVVCMVFLIVKNVWQSASVVPALVAGVGAAIAVPIGFYPFSKTLWVAIEVSFHEEDPVEELEAMLAVEHPDEDPPTDGEGPEVSPPDAR